MDTYWFLTCEIICYIVSNVFQYIIFRFDMNFLKRLCMSHRSIGFE